MACWLHAIEGVHFSGFDAGRGKKRCITEPEKFLKEGSDGINSY